MSHENEAGGRQTNDKGRSLVEWITLGVSAAIVLAVAGLIVFEAMRTDDEPALIVVQAAFDEVRQEGDAFYLPVEVSNAGGLTAADVRVQVRLLHADGEVETAPLTAGFMTSGGKMNGVVLFRERPTRENVVFVASYRLP